MQRFRFLVGVLAAVFVAAACSASPPLALNEPVIPDPETGALDPAAFPTSTTIDNEWLPLKPGTQWIWEGQAIEDGERVERGLIFTITDLVKEIGGIDTVVGYDRDYNDGELGEVELIFLAQDRLGNVWHFGQYSEIHEEGQFQGGSAWIAGHLDGAKPGIMMQANPSLQTPDYSEGYAPPPYFWDDWAKIDKVDQRVCVKAGCYDDVLVIREYEPTKPGAAQLKFYAPGVGNIKTGFDGKDKEKEELELVKKRTLDAAEMDEIRKAALALDTRANVYGATSPLSRR